MPIHCPYLTPPHSVVYSNVMTLHVQLGLLLWSAYIPYTIYTRIWAQLLFKVYIVYMHMYMYQFLKARHLSVLYIHLCFTGVVCWACVSFLSSFPLRLPQENIWSLKIDLLLQCHVLMYSTYGVPMCMYMCICVHVLMWAVVLRAVDPGAMLLIQWNFSSLDTIGRKRYGVCPFYNVAAPVEQ